MTISPKTVAALAMSAMVAFTALNSPALARGIGVVIHTPLNPNIPIHVDKPGPETVDINSNTPIIVPFKPRGPTGTIDIPLPGDSGDKTDAPVLVLDCKVLEAGNDLWLINFGSDEIPAGTKIRFNVPSTGDHGAFLLSRSIAPGKKVRIADLLHGALENAPCRVQILS